MPHQKDHRRPKIQYSRKIICFKIHRANDEITKRANPGPVDREENLATLERPTSSYLGSRNGKCPRCVQIGRSPIRD